jgi:nucleoside 2-deoxyribosyltransferase
MKIYLAGPVITDDNTKELVNRVYRHLNACTDADIYKPGLHKVPNEWGITMEMWGQCVFTMDVLGIDNADWIVLCNFGRHGQSAGTAWECGYAFAKQKKILVVNMPGSEKDTSLMIRGCASNVVDFEVFEKEENLDNLFVERGRLPANQTLN